MSLRACKLEKSYQTPHGLQAVLHQLSIDIAPGVPVAITGESGCGKSTLLHLLASLDRPDAGSISFKQQDITQYSESQADKYRKHHLGLVFQQFNLVSALSGKDNIYLPARLTSQVDEPHINQLVEQLGISHVLDKLPEHMSGGEQQRVAIARALAHKPAVLLADEPTGNLDEHNSDTVSSLLFELSYQLNLCTLVVTHSQHVAQKAARHLHLSNGKLCE